MPTQQKLQQLKSYLQRITPGHDLEAIVDDNEAPMRMTSVLKAGQGEARRAHSAVQKLALGQEITAREAFLIEAIIIPDKRPVIDIAGGDFKSEHPDWRHYSENLSLKGNIKKVIPAVGRIELPSHPSLPYGGTGFAVGSNLLMTNRHVAELFVLGLGVNRLVFIPGHSAGIDFLREHGSDASEFLEVKKIPMVHPYWDMALLQVDRLPDGIVPLRLSVRHPEELVDREVAVIGYPAFDPRNDATVQNRVFGGKYYVKRLQPGLLRGRASVSSYQKAVDAVTHDASTLGGNSGSCVVDVGSGEVIGLHFAGIYKKENYAVPAFELSRDDKILAAGVEFTTADLDPGGSPNPWQSYWVAADPAEEAGARTTASAGATATAPTKPLLSEQNAAIWTIPITVQIGLGEIQPVVADSALPTGPTPAVSVDIERMVEPAHDENYASRPGYDENFLGHTVPMPAATNVDELAMLDTGSPVLKYHHFSIIMNKQRRLAQITAANLDVRPTSLRPDPTENYGRRALNGFTSDNDRERWFNDPRIPADHQLPDRFFNKDRKAFDKGHVVRRNAVAWGSTYCEVQHANGDTFHATNCSPQVKGFNRSSEGGLWGELENHVFAQAATQKLIVFAGPILRSNDPLFAGVDDSGSVGVKIPGAYWKVAVASHADGLRVFAFMLEQDLDGVDWEFRVTDKWKTHQLTLASLQAELETLQFDPMLHDADQAQTEYGESLRWATRLELRNR